MSNVRRAFRCGLLSLVLIAASLPAWAASNTLMGFVVGVREAPPPPRVILLARPQVVVVPGTSVYVVENPSYDVFRYGSSFYVMSDGYWYRSRSGSGPFVVVDVRSVPRPILRVPGSHWKHHPHGGPPGQMKKAGHGRH